MGARNIKILVTILGTLLSTVPVLAYRNVAAPAPAKHSATSSVMSNAGCESAAGSERP